MSTSESVRCMRTKGSRGIMDDDFFLMTFLFRVQTPQEPKFFPVVVRFLMEMKGVGFRSIQIDNSPFDSQYIARKERLETSWLNIIQWLHGCDFNHLCVTKTMSLCLPTRLLDLGFESCPSLHLRESSKELSTERYVTLSHCWGNKTCLSASRAK